MSAQQIDAEHALGSGDLFCGAGAVLEGDGEGQARLGERRLARLVETECLVPACGVPVRCSPASTTGRREPGQPGPPAQGRRPRYARV
ncbi:hypothetical protein ACWC9U_07220 [Streptomyces sp. 900116325]